MAPDRWQDAEAYERYIGRWSRRVADAFVAWLNVPDGIGLGRRRLRHRRARGPDRRPDEAVAGRRRRPLARLRGGRPRAGHRPGRRRSRSGGPIALPIDDGAADAVVSGLVLNFVPDVAAALSRGRAGDPAGRRWSRPTCWDYAGRMELIRRFWDAAVALGPGGRRARRGPPVPDRRAATASRSAWADAGALRTC